MNCNGVCYHNFLPGWMQRHSVCWERHPNFNQFNIELENATGCIWHERFRHSQKTAKKYHSIYVINNDLSNNIKSLRKTIPDLCHYVDVTWASWCLKSPTSVMIKKASWLTLSGVFVCVCVCVGGGGGSMTSLSGLIRRLGGGGQWRHCQGWFAVSHWLGAGLGSTLILTFASWFRDINMWAL